MSVVTRIRTSQEITVPFALEEVWAVLADVPAYPEWWPKKLGVEILHHTGELLGTEFEVRPLLGRMFRIRVEELEGTRSMRFRFFGGSLEGPGGFHLHAREGATEVRYEMDVFTRGLDVAVMSMVLPLESLHRSRMRSVLNHLAGRLKTLRKAADQRAAHEAYSLERESDTRRQAEEEAARRLAAEEASRKRAEEQAAARAAAEELERRAAAEEAERRAAEAEAMARAAEEAGRRAAEAEARRRVEEAAAARAAAEAAERRAAEEEAARVAAAEASRKRAEEQALARAKAEELERRAAEEEAERRAAEAAAKAQAEEEAARRAAEEEARRRAEEDAAARAAAQEAERRATEEEALRLAAQEASRKQAEEEAAARAAAAEAERRAAEEEAERRAAEAAAKAQAEEEAARRAAEEEARRRAEEDAAARAAAEAAERRAAEEEAARVAAAEAARRRAEDEAAARVAAEESRRRAARVAAARAVVDEASPDVSGDVDPAALAGEVSTGSRLRPLWGRIVNWLREPEAVLAPATLHAAQDTPNPPVSNFEIARRYLDALSSDAPAEEFGRYFAAEVTDEEFPHRFLGTAVTRGFDGILEARKHALIRFSSQRYELAGATGGGSQVAMEVRWKGSVATTGEGFAKGQELDARLAVFLKFADGKIVRQRIYSCFELWSTRAERTLALDERVTQAGQSMKASLDPSGSATIEPGGSNFEIARRYLQALSERADAETIARYYAADAVQDQFPNRLLPEGAHRDLQAIEIARSRDLALMASEGYELLGATGGGSQVALEVAWSGVVGEGPGRFAAGQRLETRRAIFLKFREGLIVAQRNYDCA